MQNVVQLFSSENPSALVDRAELTECIGLLAKLCGGRQALPILSHIRMASETGGIALTATNLDIQAETAIAADVDARFSVALPAAALLKLMKKGTPSGTTILELLPDGRDDEAEQPAKCGIQLATSRFVLDTLPSSEFPAPLRHTEGEKVHRLSIASAVLWNAIDGTIDAVSTDETRPNLNGIHIHDHNGRLRFVTTDGHRLYIQDTNIQTGKSGISAILPTEGAKFVASLLDGHASAEPVRVEISSSVAVFVFRDVAVTVKLIDGTFPDYQRVMPDSPDKTAMVAGAALAAAVTSIVECTGAALVRLHLTADAIVIGAKGDIGEGSTQIECTYDGEDIEIAFQAKYIRSAIEAASPDGRSMKIRFADGVSPALVTGSIGGWTGVLMPSHG